MKIKTTSLRIPLLISAFLAFGFILISALNVRAEELPPQDSLTETVVSAEDEETVIATVPEDPQTVILPAEEEVPASDDASGTGIPAAVEPAEDMAPASEVPAVNEAADENVIPAGDEAGIPENVPAVTAAAAGGNTPEPDVQEAKAAAPAADAPAEEVIVLGEDPEPSYVACIVVDGEIIGKYESIQAAQGALTKNDGSETIRLLADVDLSLFEDPNLKIFYVTKSFTLDLNGFTISASGDKSCTI